MQNEMRSISLYPAQNSTQTKLKTVYKTWDFETARGKHRLTPRDLGTDKHFLKRAPKTQEKLAKVDRWDYITKKERKKTCT